MAGGKGVFYARAPYMNKDLGAGAHATRFIGLAPVGNAAKQKFLHALALVPAVDMDQKALTVHPCACIEVKQGCATPEAAESSANTLAGRCAPAGDKMAPRRRTR